MPALPFDKLVTSTLLRRFELEAGQDDGDGRYFALIRREDGDLLSHHPIGPPISSEQIIFASALLKILNKDLHHDGAWVIVFTHPKPMSSESLIHQPRASEYARYALIWLDQDGDPQFTQDWLENHNDELRTFTHVLLAGPEQLVNKCENSWKIWHELMRQVLQPKDGQTYKKAQGQRAPSLLH